ASLKKAHAAIERFLNKTGWDEMPWEPQAGQVQRRLLEDALYFYEEFLADAADDPSLTVEVARATVRVAHIRARMGDVDGSQAAYRRAAAVLLPLVNDFPDEPSYRDDLARAHLGLAVALIRQKRYEEAETAVRESVRLFEALTHDGRDRPAPRAPAYYELGCVLTLTGRYSDAEAEHRRALAVFEPLARYPGTPERYRAMEASVHESMGLAYSAM